MTQSPDLDAERAARLDAALADLRALDPSWAELFRTYVLDGMYTRDVLDQRTRELAAVAALTVLDRQGPLSDHIKGALRHGATPAEVLEVILQASVYGGFPVTLAGIRTYRETCAAVGVEPTSR